ncbi:MarR family winged helix-turn-helix transcriptional regulator [Pseudonocardia sp. N23]|uniref:MarR family winged helix-turn-helix transcriptional regulator n=1 Tax=Pseudonocardia sp. N23 TaxID=1987376 RepID=UPI000BFBBD67|nr:MarR family winged helix-turn-helix transcriptional regulator [Pseudonocardia sp. N23]GAY11370.1 transcriptional regulator, MarR family [Pseudonocardia sp. N23]
MAASEVHSALAFGQLLHRLERAVSRRIESALAGEASLDQWRVLDLLSDDAGHPMSEIAAHVAVPAPTLTKIVDRMVDAGLVHRRADDVDRRRVLVLLADHGRDLHTRLALAVGQAEQDVTAALGDDAPVVRAMLERLAHRLT